MTAGPDLALVEIANARALTVGPYDLIALGLVESEIYRDSLHSSQALECFEKNVDPSLPNLDPADAAIIADNKSLLLMESSGGIGDFYHLVDVRRILGVELRNHASMLEARADAAKGEHFKALPLYWQQLRLSYEIQNWRAREVAERDYSEECLQLGWFEESAYHAVLSGSKDAIDRTANVLLAKQSAEHIEAVIKRLLRIASLKRHALQIMRFVSRCADAVPETCFNDVVLLISTHGAAPFTDQHQIELFNVAWEAIGAVSDRLDSSRAVKLATSGFGNQLFQKGGRGRDHLLNGLSALIGRIPVEQLDGFVEPTLRLVTDWRSDPDYLESLELLCSLAHCGNEDIKSRFRRGLFPPGIEIRDALLVRIGPAVGWQPPQAVQFSEVAQKAADAVRKQVQRLAPAEEPVQIGGYGVFSSPLPSGRIVIHIHGALHLIQALASHRMLLDENSATSLIAAMLEMIADSENLIVNRSVLAQSLRDFVEQIPSQLEADVVKALEPLARGFVTESIHGQSHAEATNPLNPFKMGGGDPETLRGAALAVLCRLDHCRPNFCPALHDGILLDALTSSGPNVRRYALAAAAEAGSLSPIERTTISLACLDPDPKVAKLAMHAIIRSNGINSLDPISWQTIVRAIEIGSKAIDGSYRAASATLITRLPVPPVEVAQRLQIARTALEHDLLFSVRHQFTN